MADEITETKSTKWVEESTRDATGTSFDEDAEVMGSYERPERNLAKAIWAIVCGVALPCIPIIVVSIVLLVVIFKYRVIPRAGWPEFYLATGAEQELNNVTDYIFWIRKQGGTPAYYVKYNPSTITTIAGWTGRVIPYLASSVMALVAFYAARHIVVKSKRGLENELLSPKQLNILINLLSGSGWDPLKEAVFHRWGSKERFVSPLPAAFSALFIITLLAILIPIIDTWFGVAVHPVTITQLSNTSTNAYHSFGRSLDPNSTYTPNCAEGPLFPAVSGNNLQSFGWPCNIMNNNSDNSMLSLMGSEATAALQLNLPSKDIISNYTGPPPNLNSGISSENVSIYFIGDPRNSPAVDFRARTIGMSTHCEIITTECYNGSDSVWFQCPGGFQGDFTACAANQSWDAAGPCTTGIGFAADAHLSRMANLTRFDSDYPYNGNKITELLQQNPIYFGTWALHFPNPGDNSNPLWRNRDPDIFNTNDTSFSVWLLNCSATIYDVNYTSVNGSMHTFKAEPTTGDWGAFISAPFTWMLDGTGLQQVRLALENAAYLASYTSQNGSNLANIWANEFSKSALALSSGVFVPLVNDLEQRRERIAGIARVPLIPLYLLLGFKFLYIFVIIVMAIGVYCFTHPAETEVVKAQLSVQGLVAAHFDDSNLIRSNVVKEMQSRLDQARGDTFSSSSSPTCASPPARARTMPATEKEREEAEDKKPRIGLIPTAEGAWTFALLVNGAWKSVKPIVKDIALSEARGGQFGTAGDAYAAWK